MSEFMSMPLRWLLRLIGLLMRFVGKKIQLCVDKVNSLFAFCSHTCEVRVTGLSKDQ